MRDAALRQPRLAAAGRVLDRPDAEPVLAPPGERGPRSACGVTLARGFRASGIHCGIRRRRPDLALIVSDRPAAAAAVFTRSLAQAAPILVSRNALAASGGIARAVVVNAGNANACTGEPGLLNARRTTARVAELLGLPVEQVLVASTGVIGQQLPIDCVLGGLPRAARSLSRSGGEAAARAILTTDLHTKLASRAVRTERGSFTVGGMAKGSGMIHPDMATTLGFVTTDAAIDPALLRECLLRATGVSFNRITVDGDTSTNDMVAVLANGASGIEVRRPGTAPFEKALTAVLTDLARMVVRDGEGATKLIAVTVEGAPTEAEALRVARTIAGSPLVKTAVHGADANWGRIVAAASRAGVTLDPGRLTVALGGVIVLEPGYVSRFSEADAKLALEQDEVTLTVGLGLGAARATVWTCDLTAGYVAINAGYRS